MTKTHWSDCALYRGPAYEPGPCNCGCSELADDALHISVTALVARPRRLRSFVQQCNASSFVEAQHLPPDRLMVDAAPTDLPDTHNGVASSADANGMDLNIARKAVITDF